MASRPPAYAESNGHCAGRNPCGHKGGSGATRQGIGLLSEAGKWSCPQTRIMGDG